MSVRPVHPVRLGLVISVTCLLLMVVAASPAQAGQPAAYEPPVDAPVSDPFHIDGGPYGPGNRGIEYATAAGDVVVAAAQGTVVFAGSVAGRRYVTIRHADGVRTAYGPLRDLLVTAGTAVAQGQPIGTAAGALLFTARVGEAYIDPATLLSRTVTVHLVPTWSTGTVPGYTARPARHLVGYSTTACARPTVACAPSRSTGVRAQVSDKPLGRRTSWRPRS
ncbi:MAG: hypothetical protein QOK06_1083 [Acidimicrobiaceae bacterium]